MSIEGGTFVFAPEADPEPFDLTDYETRAWFFAAGLDAFERCQTNGIEGHEVPAILRNLHDAAGYIGRTVVTTPGHA